MAIASLADFGCKDDGVCDPVGDDCVCADLQADEQCSATYCVDDGVCDVFSEGCACSDCALHPACT